MGEHRSIRDELIRSVDRLPEAAQREVLRFARSLNGAPGAAAATDAEKWAALAGSVSDNDAARMMHAIEEECERVHPDEW